MALQPLEERVTRLELGQKELGSKQESTESRMLTKADIRKLEADVAELKENMNDVLSGVIRLEDKLFGDRESS